MSPQYTNSVIWIAKIKSPTLAATSLKLFWSDYKRNFHILYNKYPVSDYQNTMQIIASSYCKVKQCLCDRNSGRIFWFGRDQVEQYLRPVTAFCSFITTPNVKKTNVGRYVYNSEFDETYISDKFTLSGFFVLLTSSIQIGYHFV